MASLVVTSLMTACGNVAAVESPTATPAPTPATEPARTAIPTSTAEPTKTPIPLPTPSQGFEPTIASDLSIGIPHTVNKVEASQDFMPLEEKPNASGMLFSCSLESGSTITPIKELPDHQFLAVYERPENTHSFGTPVNSCSSGVRLYVISDPNYPNDIITPVENFTPQLMGPLPVGASRRVLDALIPNSRWATIYPFIASVKNDWIYNGYVTFRRNDQGYKQGDTDDDSYCWPLPNGTIRIIKNDINTGLETVIYTEPASFKRNVDDPKECPTGTIFLTRTK